MRHHSHTCVICQKAFHRESLISGELVRPEIAEEIKRTKPDWSSEQFICYSDLMKMRSRYVHSLLKVEKGELTTLEHAVLRSLHQQEILSTKLEADFDQKWNLSERLADKIAAFGGSWRFLIAFGVFLTAWIVVNSIAFGWHPADPYPFIFLNLILSCIAAVQAPVIMMSQNRQESKDRIRSQHDYQINLKAELEIRHLHEKVDHLLSHQWERLVQIQEIQIELLSELSGRKK